MLKLGGRPLVVLPLGVSAPPYRRRPYVTGGLVAALLAVFVHVLLLRDAPPALFCTDLTESPQALARSADTVQGFVCRWGTVPDELPRTGRWGTLVTALLVHTGWLHLLGNLAFLAAFAPRVEEDLGHGGLLALFVGCGAVSGWAHVLLDPNATTPTIGASGGVAGVLGAHLLLSRGASVRVLVGPVPMRLPSRFVISVWALLQLGYTAVLLRRADPSSAVAYEVHAVGFLLGVAVVSVLRLVRPGLGEWAGERPRRRTRIVLAEGRRRST
jgi:membrane associated rhomboid family serine protease